METPDPRDRDTEGGGRGGQGRSTPLLPSINYLALRPGVVKYQHNGTLVCQGAWMGSTVALKSVETEKQPKGVEGLQRHAAASNAAAMLQFVAIPAIDGIGVDFDGHLATLVMEDAGDLLLSVPGDGREGLKAKALACLNDLHLLNIAHGDATVANCCVRKSGLDLQVMLVDLSDAYPCKDEIVLRQEMNHFAAELSSLNFA